MMLLVVASCEPPTIEPAKYSLQYKANGANSGLDQFPQDSGRYLEGESVSLKDARYVGRDLYSFIGWDTMPTGTGTRYLATDILRMSGHDLVLFAVFRDLLPPEVTYTLTMNDLGFTILEGETKTVSADLTPSIPAGGTIRWSSSHDSIATVAQVSGTSLVATIQVDYSGDLNVEGSLLNIAPKSIEVKVDPKSPGSLNFQWTGWVTKVHLFRTGTNQISTFNTSAALGAAILNDLVPGDYTVVVDYSSSYSGIPSAKSVSGSLTILAGQQAKYYVDSKFELVKF